MFDLILEDTTTTDIIDYQYIMIKVGYLESKSLSSCADSIIKEDIILPAGESVDIDVRVWISDTSNVTSMASMFYQTGASSTVFTLDLGEKFDTSGVTDMGDMFSNVGYSNTTFTLGLGDKFDTSKVTNMETMFNGIGYSNPNLVLDLSTFTFDNVTSYSAMFWNFTATKKIYVKDATAQNWIITNFGNSNLTTSNVLIKS